MGNDIVLRGENLTVSYGSKGFGRVPHTVLASVSIEIARGETLGLVGESGSGKTTLGRAVLGLVPTDSGRLLIDGHDLTNASRRERRRHSGLAQVVFQDPYTSLNPSMTIEEILAEPLVGSGLTRADARARVAGLLDRVGLPSDAASRHAAEFSGGQRQRVAIARALALRPKLIVCDEPVSALDLSTQGRVLDLLIELQQEFGIAYLFISHDLAVVRALSHRVAVLYRGHIVEQGPSAVVTVAPEHPYTRSLLLAAPLADPDAQSERRMLRRNAALGDRP